MFHLTVAGPQKHFYSDTADLTEGQIAIILN